MKKKTWRSPLGRMLALAAQIDRRIAAALIAVLALSAAFSTAAAVPPVPQYKTEQVDMLYPTFAQACAAAGDARRAQLLAVEGVWVPGSIVMTPVSCSSTWYEFTFSGVLQFNSVPSGGTYYGQVLSPSFCPANSASSSSGCQCNAGFQEDPAHTACKLDSSEMPDWRQAGMCVGNPILPATADKYRSEVDFAEAGGDGLDFGRTYRSNWGQDASRAIAPMGKAWTHSHSASLQATASAVTITTAEGYSRRFTQASTSSPWMAANSADTLSQLGGVWTYRRSDDEVTLRFDAAGRLLSTVARNGWTTTYAYNAAGQLASITNAFGRTLALAYNPAGQLMSVSAPGARTITYSYDTSGRLWLVTSPDGKTRTFAYENASFPNALTGILDETGARWGTFAYDGQGRAISTELAGAADRYQVSYPAPGSATVIDPLGTTRNYSYATQLGKLAVTGGSLPSGTGEPDAASRVQDANGLITRETDFKGVVTTITWDVARRLPTSVTRAYGTPEAQTVTTVWHPTFSLPTLVTEMGRTTSFTHDALGNVLTQTITDTVTSKSQTSQWSYNSQGLVASQTGTNGAVTVYTYDTAGNLTKARNNNAGLETSYLYDSANRVISTIAANGLITTYTWDARDRLLSQVAGALEVTTFTYSPTGTLTSLTLPTHVTFSYTYDAAHRPIGWSNNRGESGSFTLDAMGNRVSEQTKNAAGAIAWNAVRSVNNLNRVATRTQGSNQTSTFGYDANGERITETNGLNQSTRLGLDGLRRVTNLTDASNATATLAYNPLDDLTQAKDFKGVATLYARDAQGNATGETSPDVGARKTEYDSLGLPSKIVDALGQATTITRDALGRPTSLTFADGKVTTLAYDLTPYSRGYLSRIVDRSGLTDYARDAFGRVTMKRVTLSTGLVQQVLYTYKASGQLERIVYPEGSVLEHAYDATGRLTTIFFNGQPMATNITWNPMGQTTGWTWAFVPGGLAATRSFDTAARMTQSEFASYVYDAAGRITSLTQQLFVPGDTNPANSSTALAPTTWNVGYSPTGRITSFNATGNIASFAYDANGNRTSSVRTIGGQTTSKTYAVQSTSNRITGFNQTIGATTTSVTYGFNANGDMTSDGLRSFAYNAEGRLSDVTTGATDTSPTTRYAHNALGQRVFKTEPLYPPAQGDENDPGFMQSLVGFFTKLLWAPTTPDAEKLGFAFSYDEEGSLIFERGTGGPNSTGTTIYISLPTANGPMPIAAVINGQKFAVHSDHLNTPRRITNSQGKAVWQWAYSAFGDNAPTIAKNRFADLGITPNPGTTSIAPLIYNLRYMGMYSDAETAIFYNYFRTYDPRLGSYTQNDSIGLIGGWNRNIYGNANPLRYNDPFGRATREQIAGAAQVLQDSFPDILKFPNSVTGVAGLSGTLGQILAGRTDLNGNIKYNADLYGADGVPVPACKLDDFLQTMAHEMQHLNENWRDRIGISTGELLNRISPRFPSIEDTIDRNADLMYRATIEKYRGK